MRNSYIKLRSMTRIPVVAPLLFNIVPEVPANIIRFETNKKGLVLLKRNKLALNTINLIGFYFQNNPREAIEKLLGTRVKLSGQI